MAEMLLPDRSPMRIFPMWLQGWVSLCEKAVYSWLDDRAPTMGAAIAYYTVFSLAPMLVMVIAVPGSPSVRKRRKVPCSANLPTSSVRKAQ
jgi:uncharacterized BrkB/YihY/UPF0761 family membrane protein